MNGPVKCNIDYKCILKHATMTIDNWDELSLLIFVMIFPYFLVFLLIFMNMKIMQL